MAIAGRTMVPLEQALDLIDGMRENFFAALPVEEVPVEAATGRLLAEDVRSRGNMPPGDLCTMDGYALRTADGYPLAIVGEAYAGQGFRPLGRGEAVYVTTGARLPPGADAVLRVEDALVRGSELEGPPLAPGTFVVREGADLRKGEILLRRGAWSARRWRACCGPRASIA